MLIFVSIVRIILGENTDFEKFFPPIDKTSTFTKNLTYIFVQKQKHR